MVVQEPAETAAQLEVVGFEPEIPSASGVLFVEDPDGYRHEVNAVAGPNRSHGEGEVKRNYAGDMSEIREPREPAELANPRLRTLAAALSPFYVTTAVPLSTGIIDV